MQLDPSNYDVAIVNTTTNSLAGLTARASVYSLGNKLLLHHEETKDASDNAVTQAFRLDLTPLLLTGDLLLVKLELRKQNGELVSDNFYWVGSESSSSRRMNRMGTASVTVTAKTTHEASQTQVHVTLRNTGKTASLATKLTLIHATDGSRVLPAYYSDNYISLLPDETREVEIEYVPKGRSEAVQLGIRGWNIATQTVPVGGTN